MTEVIIVNKKQSLTDRLHMLRALQEAEKKGDNDQRYISDLDLSIDACERQLNVQTFQKS